jgi:hypothetical protein
MIEKFLIRFCASEVRVMVTRLHERPDDFGYGSRWRDLAESRQGFTWVERKVLDKEWGKFKKNQKRRELLSLITNEVINPTSKDKWGFTATAVSTQNQQALLDMQIKQQLAQYRQHVDPRVLYGNGSSK